MAEDIFDAFNLDQLEALRDKAEARQDAAQATKIRSAIDRRGSVQTHELYNSGKLYAHKIDMGDDSGRKMTTWTGDPSVWMRTFQTPGVQGRLAVEQFIGENSAEAKAARAETVSVRLKPGERIQVVRD